ncbi:MAG: nucleotide-binding protein [Acidobacteriota bacterium]
MRSIAVLAVLALAASGCAKKPAEAPAPAKAVPPAASVAERAAAASSAPAPVAPATNVVPAQPQPQLVTVSGTVLETFGASDYTYMRLKTSDGEIWAAVTKTKVKKGQKVTVVNAAHMDGFESKTLNRKFDRIVFGSLREPGAAGSARQAAAVSATAAPMASGHQSADIAQAREVMLAQHGQAAGGPSDAPDVKVEKAKGANAKTVAELWAQRTALRGKEVVVKAKVVKVTPGVMGKNWLHVRDGSGSRETKDNDLTVTTNASAKVGDVVTVSGIVSVDKDFGAGYAYPAIVENAKLE